VLSVVAPALKPLVLIDTEPAGVCEANAVVNATEPPVDAVPVTTRKAELSPVDVFLVQPVGADVWANSITVPVGNPAAAAEVQAVPFEVSTLPAVPGEDKPVPPEAAPNAFVNDTAWLELIVIAVVSPVWISNEFELSPVEINPPGEVVVLLIIDDISIFLLQKRLRTRCRLRQPQSRATHPLLN